MSRKIVIAGGTAGGASAAAKARRQDENADIIMFERGPYISFANCGLPYFISGDIKERDKLFVQTTDVFKNRFNVESKINCEVISINRLNKEVDVLDLTKGKVFKERYDNLILATGANPIMPPIIGIDAKNVFKLQSIPDMDEIVEYLNTRSPKRALVIGGGFIGLELVEALTKRGLKVTIVELLNQLMPSMDADMASFITKHLREKGVSVHLKDGVKALHGEEFIEKAELYSGARIPTDIVIVSIGVRPNVCLAKDARLHIGNTGAVWVNERQETSDPNIYAVGDMTESTHIVTKKKTWIPLATSATKQGRVAGANAAGGNKLFKGVLGTSIVKVMDIAAARTGLSEKEAKALGLDYYVSYTNSPSHANYYPDASALFIKLVVERGNGRLLGAQVVGEKGVDKRIDVFASALYSGLTVMDLEDLDLAYAPPYSSSRDPVVIAGMAASNILREEIESVTPNEVRKRTTSGKSGPQFLDVRTSEEIDEGYISGMKHVPLDNLRGRLGELDRTRGIIVYCRSGLRSYLAARILSQKGFKDVKNMSGGYIAWIHQGNE
jgi:NADPH-dependent 2,4-dienoyl-CoA reductase/sulfur reductase-like enzyme/rhodanese-related sulfurtransferase